MGAKLRVMHVLEATVGGTRRHVLDLLNRLPADRFAQHLVCSPRNEACRADITALQAAGVTVTVIPMRRDVSARRDYAALRDLEELITRERPDIVHGHSAKGGFLARLAARRVGGAKTVYNPHGFPFQMRVSPLQRWTYLRLEQWAGGLTDRLVAVCEGQRELALRHGLVPAERCVVIHNGVESAAYADGSSRDEVRAGWGLGPEVSVIGTVAALVPQKNVGALVRAATTVLREPLAAAFVVVGDGPQRQALERLAGSLGCAERMRFLGQREDVPRLLPAFDLFVLPSLWEGLPYALLEAGAAGLPVVATDIPGNRDVVAGGTAGFLARPDDPLDLAVSLMAALRSPERQAMGQRLRERVAAEFNLEGMIAGHMALYEELAGE